MPWGLLGETILARRNPSGAARGRGSQYTLVVLQPMNEEILRRLFRALNEHGARYTLFGGLAVGALGLPRATKDVDLLIESSAANVEAVVEALRSVFAD